MNNQTYGDAALKGGSDIISQLLKLVDQFNPANAGIKAGQAGMNTEVGQNPTGNMTKAVLSPYQQGVEKALKKSAEAHVAEAIMQGVPPQHIEQEAGLSPQQMNPGQLQNSPYQQNAPGAGTPQPGNNVNQAFLAGQQPMQQPQAQAPQGQNILQSLMSMIYQPSSIQNGNTYQPASLLGGLMRTSG